MAHILYCYFCNQKYFILKLLKKDIFVWKEIKVDF